MLNFLPHFIIIPQPHYCAATAHDSALKASLEKFPYLHHQLHCIVDEHLRYHRAYIQWTIDASACVCWDILTSRVDAFGHLSDHAARCVNSYRHYENSTHPAVDSLWMHLHYHEWCDDAAYCHYAYAVTSCRVAPRVLLVYTIQLRDTPRCLKLLQLNNHFFYNY